MSHATLDSGGVPHSPHADSTQDLCLTDYIKRTTSKDAGLMGAAHAVSGAGFGILALSFIPSLSDWGISNMATLVLVMIGVCGAVMVPDLDNTKASIISALGVTGKPASTAFRASSRLVQAVIRSPKDPAVPNPHRGFWHSFVGAGVAGGIVYGITQIPYSVNVPLVGDITAGTMLAFIITVALMNVMNVSLPNNPQSLLLKHAPSFEMGSIILSTIVVGVLFTELPEGHNFVWLAVSVTIGMSIHIVGDALTTQGVPMFFPVIGLFRGRLWWKTRLTSLEAKNKGLNNGVIIVSFIVGMYGLYRMMTFGVPW